MKDNITDGSNCYNEGDAETKDWFERQWKYWPVRVDERHTTNISFLYGGLLAYREEHGKDPRVSIDFASHVRWHDKHRNGG